MEENYKVLYRKYRPSSFDEVIGQKYTIQMLKNAVINNKISHAYIFTGPRGTGKTSTAKIFARTINCEDVKDGIPCCKCNSCLSINNNADIIEIDAASNNGVDEIRELINNVKIAPTFSKYKVYIIDEVHMMSKSAFNALLLTLEEPPSHVVFILATTNIENVPITILSRCQRYDFKKITFENLVEHIKKVAEKEKIKITDEAVEEIAYLSEGGCRDALSILNQLSTSSETIDLEVVLSNYGSVSFVQIKNIITYFLEDNYSSLKEIFDSLRNSAIDYKFFLKKMIDLLFNEALLLNEKHDTKNFLKIKDTVFELNALINQINITIEPFLLIFLVFTKYMNKIDVVMEKEVIPKIVKEDIKEKEVVKEKIQEKIEEEKKEKENVVSQKTESNNKLWQEYIENLKNVRLNNCFASADKNLLNEFKEKWLKFVENVDSTNAIKSVIMDTNVVLASKDINIITHLQNSMVELFNNELDNIKKEYQKYMDISLNFLAISNEDWENSKKDYVKKLKEHYEYKILEEPTYQQENSENNVEMDNEEDYTAGIFDKEKLEVQ